MTKKYKDWKPGTVRVKVHIVNEKGVEFDFYLPFLSPENGEEIFNSVAKVTAETMKLKKPWKAPTVTEVVCEKH